MSALHPETLSLVVGSTWSDTWVLYYSDGETPVPMSGWSAVMEFRRKRGESGSALKSISSAAGDIVLDEATGEIAISFEASSAMEGRGVWALELTNDSTEVEEYIHGEFECLERLVGS